MNENFLWAVFGIFSALIGVVVVYLKNSQKISDINENKSNINQKIKYK
ncbi:MAG: hypothetical protein P8X42_18880 [Calditrichaceae bacterium]|jgi:hypothetical protein